MCTCSGTPLLFLSVMCTHTHTHTHTQRNEATKVTTKHTQNVVRVMRRKCIKR
jgi:hypothetical protein